MAETYEHHAAGLEPRHPMLSRLFLMIRTRFLPHARHLCGQWWSSLPDPAFRRDGDLPEPARRQPAAGQGHPHICNPHHRHRHSGAQLSAPSPADLLDLKRSPRQKPTKECDTFMTSFQVDVSKMKHPPLIGPCGSLDSGVPAPFRCRRPIGNLVDLAVALLPRKRREQ